MSCTSACLPHPVRAGSKRLAIAGVVACLLAGAATAQVAVPPASGGGTGDAGARPVMAPRTMTPEATAKLLTPQAMREAKPVPLPTVESRPPGKPPQMGTGRRAATAGRSSEGFPPTVSFKNIRPQRLYTPLRRGSPRTRATRGDVAPLAFSDFGDPYTHSRIPAINLMWGYPYSTVGKLYITAATGTYVCSGSVIQWNVVVTAAHCLYNTAFGGSGWAQALTFVPGFYNGFVPWAQWTGQQWWVMTTWIADPNVSHPEDVGVINLNLATIFGKTYKIAKLTGALGIQTSSPSTHYYHATVLGYPVALDGGVIPQRSDSHTHWVSSVDDVAEYGSDSTGGVSGGPIVIDFQVTPSGGTSRTPKIISVVSYRYLFYQGVIGGSLLTNDGPGGFVDEIYALIGAACSYDPSDCSP